jgi:hypothetical protein
LHSTDSVFRHRPWSITTPEYDALILDQYGVTGESEDARDESDEGDGDGAGADAEAAAVAQVRKTHFD